MNYGEELGYWYLRLNGFFPIKNFVIHRREGIEHRSDYDLIAVRPPNVFEEIGGQPDDWDRYLRDNIDFMQFTGLLCEVKTGQFDENKLFREEYLESGVERLGLFSRENTPNIVEALSENPGYPVAGGSYTICKLLISPDKHTSDKCLNRTITQVEDFILTRAQKYSDEKFASRMFFPSPMFQLLIAQAKKLTGNTCN